jgi:hypothetical protein
MANIAFPQADKQRFKYNHPLQFAPKPTEEVVVDNPAVVEKCVGALKPFLESDRWTTEYFEWSGTLPNVVKAALQTSDWTWNHKAWPDEPCKPGGLPRFKHGFKFE